MPFLILLLGRSVFMIRTCLSPLRFCLHVNVAACSVLGPPCSVTCGVSAVLFSCTGKKNACSRQRFSSFEFGFFSAQCKKIRVTAFCAQQKFDERAFLRQGNLQPPLCFLLHHAFKPEWYVYILSYSALLLRRSVSICIYSNKKH